MFLHVLWNKVIDAESDQAIFIPTWFVGHCKAVYSCTEEAGCEG